MQAKKKRKTKLRVDSHVANATVGDEVVVGRMVGIEEGAEVGAADGIGVGDSDGSGVGDTDGIGVGAGEGTGVGEDANFLRLCALVEIVP
jgi:hypothetical protein